MKTLYAVIIAATLSACASQTGSVTSHALVADPATLVATHPCCQIITLGPPGQVNCSLPDCPPEGAECCRRDERLGPRCLLWSTVGCAYCPDKKFDAECRRRGGTTKRTGATASAQSTDLDQRV